MIIRKEFQNTIDRRIDGQRRKLEKLIDSRIDSHYAKDGEKGVIINVKNFQQDVIDDIIQGYRKGGWIVNWDQERDLIIIR